MGATWPCSVRVWPPLLPSLRYALAGNAACRRLPLPRPACLLLQLSWILTYSVTWS